MHRTLPVLLVLCLSSAWAAPAEPVTLEKGASPDKRFDVVLEADKDTPSFARYEMKVDSVPKFLVRELATNRIVGKAEWPGDPTGGDAGPLRHHIRGILWRADSLAVAINSSERFYSHTTIFAHDPKENKFVQVTLPEYKVLTGYDEPNQDDLRARGHERVVEWTPEGLLVYTLAYSPLPAYKGKDPLQHKILLRVSAKGMEVVSREVPKKSADH